MGWTYTHRPRGQSHAKFFSDEWGPGANILATHATPRAIYMAVRHVATGAVFAAVVLYRWVPRDAYNFGYKDMDETMGPCESECPDNILAMLSAPANDHAAAWRERCRAFNASRAKAAKMPAPGTVIRTRHPLRFGDREFDTFRRVTVSRRRFVFQPQHGDGRVADFLTRLGPATLARVGFDVVAS